MTEQRAEQFVDALFNEDLHAKRILSLAHVTLGVLRSTSLAIHAIGAGLALARPEIVKKHAVKQVDRFLGNDGIDVSALFGSYVDFVVGNQSELVIAMDWTDFDRDDQTTIALKLVTAHGRALPLLWKTVKKSELKNRRNAHEDELLERLRQVLPATVTKVTILADRGFGDSELYAALNEDWGFSYVIRFRGCVLVEDETGEVRPAEEWVPPNGRAKLLRNARVTAQRHLIPGVAVVKAKGMKEAWCLAVGSAELSAAQAVTLYGKRFTIEETFRDIKDLRFGMGLSATRISTPQRRDRLLLVSALAIALLTLLGAAGEAAGLERYFKANTSKKRTYSLFRQGCMYYESLPVMREEWIPPLVTNFYALLAAHRVFAEIFGAK